MFLDLAPNEFPELFIRLTWNFYTLFRITLSYNVEYNFIDILNRWIFINVIKVKNIISSLAGRRFLIFQNHEKLVRYFEDSFCPSSHRNFFHCSGICSWLQTNKALLQMGTDSVASHRHTVISCSKKNMNTELRCCLKFPIKIFILQRILVSEKKC